ncbi:MAG: hypothetical protein Q4B71_05135 [Cardiobacteriaceae bacterium]|nr:hypothetical protein [Cardiobacteriaceae bacterium]
MKSQTFAAVDLGSNSFHLVVAREVNGAVQWLDRLKERVQLAQGLQANGELDEASLARATETLQLFAERLQGIPPENIRTLATYTLRQASNREEALKRFATVYPYPIEIISGHEEAHWIYQGVAHTQVDNGRRLVVDIGGGSTELIVGEGFEVLLAESRHMGCVRDSLLYFSDTCPREEAFTQAYQSALHKLEDLSWDYRQLGWQEALGCSGTFRAVSEAIIAHGFQPEGLITPESVAKLKALWLTHQPLLGVSEDRVAVIGAGLAIVCALVDGLRIERLRYVESALREGVLYSFLAREPQGIAQQAVESLQHHYHVDRAHARAVAKTLSALLRHAPFEKQGQSALGRVGLAAALLHEVGRIVHHKGYQKHSAYLISHSDLLGFSAEDKALLVWLVRYHCKSLKGAEAEWQEAWGSLADGWFLLLALRIAVMANRVRGGEVVEMMLSVLEGSYRLEFAPNREMAVLLVKALEEEVLMWDKVGIEFEVLKRD